MNRNSHPAHKKRETDDSGRSSRVRAAPRHGGTGKGSKKRKLMPLRGFLRGGIPPHAGVGAIVPAFNARTALFMRNPWNALSLPGDAGLPLPLWHSRV